MVMGGFRDLVAFRQAVRLAEDMHDAVGKWPKFQQWSIGMQLVRAADSVGHARKRTTCCRQGQRIALTSWAER